MSDPSPKSKAAQVKAIWDALYTIFATEKALGNAGRLATLQDIRRSIHFWTDASPVLGVMPHKWAYVADYGTRQQIVSVDMLIALGASSDETASRPANLDDAMYANLQPLLDDGAGNGIENVFHDPANFLLGGLSINSKLSDATWDWRINDGPQQRIWAYVVYTLTVQTIVQI